MAIGAEIRHPSGSKNVVPRNKKTCNSRVLCTYLRRDGSTGLAMTYSPLRGRRFFPKSLCELSPRAEQVSPGKLRL